MNPPGQVPSTYLNQIALHLPDATSASHLNLNPHAILKLTSQPALAEQYKSYRQYYTSYWKQASAKGGVSRHQLTGRLTERRKLYKYRVIRMPPVGLRRVSFGLEGFADDCGSLRKNMFWYASPVQQSVKYNALGKLCWKKHEKGVWD